MRRIFLALFCVASVLARESSAVEFHREIPKATWEPIFFESINDLADSAGWTPLRQRALPPDSAEVRVWVGFGLAPLEGFSLRRNGSKWTGYYVSARGRKTARAAVKPVTPKSGWDQFWNSLVRRELLTLPDASTLPDQQMVMDGVSYVVEINQDGCYRTYQYGNPKYQKWPQAKKIRDIIKILYEEFGAQEQL